MKDVDAAADVAPDGTVVEGDDARRAVLASLAERVILPTYRAFATQAEALAAAASALATAEAEGDDGASGALEAARAAWRDAVDVWQQAEVFKLGPASPMGSSPGGADLRDRIYSWPIVNPCRVDQDTMAGTSDPAELADSPVNVRGLAALEVLLFDPDRFNACPGSIAMNLDGSWAALSDEELRRRRATHARAVALDLAGSAEALVTAWDRSGGAFVDKLGRAGLEPTYDSAQAALNALSDALFYVESDVKDMKVAGPLGLRDCPTDVCPDRLESRFAGRSREHILNNLRGFRLGILGGDPLTEPDALGFDDLLEAIGQGPLAADLSAAIDGALVACAAIAEPIEATLASDPASVQAAYDALKRVTDILRGDFISVLDLELPKRVEGDND